MVKEEKTVKQTIEEVVTVRQTLEEVAEAICDGYCKWPEAYESRMGHTEEAFDAMNAEKCSRCALNRLI